MSRADLFRDDDSPKKTSANSWGIFSALRNLMDHHDQQMTLAKRASEELKGRMTYGKDPFAADSSPTNKSVDREANSTDSDESASLLKVGM